MNVKITNNNKENIIERIIMMEIFLSTNIITIFYLIRFKKILNKN